MREQKVKRKALAGICQLHEQFAITKNGRFYLFVLIKFIRK